MSKNAEIKAVSEFLQRVEYVYAQVDELMNLSNYLVVRYENIINGDDNYIPSGAWFDVIGGSNDEIVSGNINSLSQLYETISGWQGLYAFEELV